MTRSDSMYTRLSISALFTLVLLLSAAAFGTAQAQPQPTDPGSDYPTYDPAKELYMDLNAQLLAEDIKHLYGGDHWNDSLFISFDYVGYTKDNVQITRYHQEWNRLTNEALLTGKLDDGRPFEVHFSNLSRRQGTMTIDSVPVNGDFLPSALETAYSQFIFNTRWLLLPVQLFDSGTTLHRLEDTTVGGKRVSTLEVRFQQDSTPSDIYFLIYVNPTYKNIERWRISNNGNARDYIWRLYQRVEPFLLSTKRWAEDFETYIQFENIEIRTVDKKNSQTEKGRSN